MLMGPSTRNIFDTIAQIEVGPGRNIFYVHKGLLCNIAPYFKAALEGGFREVRCPFSIRLPSTKA